LKKRAAELGVKETSQYIQRERERERERDREREREREQGRWRAGLWTFLLEDP